MAASRSRARSPATCAMRRRTRDLNAAYIKIGHAGCDMGAGYLPPRLVGARRDVHRRRARAADGLVSEIAPECELVDTCLKLAADMLKTAPMGPRLTKER